MAMEIIPRKSAVIDMEVAADFGQLFDTSIVRMDTNLLKKLNPRKFPIISAMIDKMGKLSSEAQRLKRPLTSYEKLLDSEDQFLYVLWEPGVRPNQSVVVGMLKIGYKNLYLYDRSVRSYKVKPLCILDFYVHSSKQRQGFGHRLFDYMLERESVAAAAVAIDKPSDSLLAFLSKHYGLTNPIWQTINFVVYPEFFHIVDADKDSLNGRADQLKSPDSTKSEPEIFEPQYVKRTVETVASTFASQFYSSPSPSQSSVTPSVNQGNFIARPSTASVSNAQMAKGRKNTSLDHQHLW